VNPPELNIEEKAKFLRMYSEFVADEEKRKKEIRPLFVGSFFVIPVMAIFGAPNKAIFGTLLVWAIAFTIYWQDGKKRDRWAVWKIATNIKADSAEAQESQKHPT
jgi:hypothetical protein